MAVKPYFIYLMQKSGSTYTKLCDIKTRPSLYGTPENVDITTLSDTMRQYVPGVKENDPKTIAVNYDHTLFETLKALEGTELDLALYFGEAGADGKFEFKGEIIVSLAEGGVNDPVDITLTLFIHGEISDNT